jgi:anaerobic magnesium-protoporphyrin IX monomethyl ester cyclase
MINRYSNNYGKTLKVLFVYPNLYMMNMMPPAIAVFSALLKQKGIEVALFDTTYYPWDHAQNNVLGQGVGKFDLSSDKRKENNLQVRPFDLSDRGIQPKDTNMLDDFKTKVNDFMPDLIAMSCVEDTFPQGVHLLNQIMDQGIPTIVGGVFATFAPHLVIKHNSVDMVCVGEGETCIVNLCEKLSAGIDYSDVPNLWIKDQFGKIRKNPPAPLTNLDTLPIMDFEIFEENRIYRPMAGKVYRMIPIETHRGCPFTCTYCNSPAQVTLHKEENLGSYFRRRSIDRIREEISTLTNRWDAEYIYFPADTFLAWKNKEFEEFISMYEEFKLPFWMQTRPETITEQKVDQLYSVNCHRVSVGIEHGNEKFRREVVNRKITNDLLVERTNILGKKIPVSVNNITGFPTETRELAFDTIKLNRRLEVDTMNCYTYMPYNGTPLRRLAVSENLLDENAMTCSLTAGSVLDMPYYPRSEIEKIVKVFSLYARLPESLWPKIKRAEENDQTGNELFNELRETYINKYFNDGIVTFS